MVNVVAYAVIRRYMTVTAGEETKLEGFGISVHQIAALFYADDGIIAPPQPSRLQEALEVLTGLSHTAGLRTNVEK